MDYSTIFAENLRNYRKAMKLTQGQLAERIGYTEKAISKWELGGSIPHAETLILLAETFNVSLDDLFEHEEEPSYFLGVDGGATKTAFALSDAEGNIISELVLGPSNPIDLGFDAACSVIAEGINKITAKAKPVVKDEPKAQPKVESKTESTHGRSVNELMERLNLMKY